MTEVAAANERIKAQAKHDREKATDEAKQTSGVIEGLGKLYQDKQTQLAEKILALHAGANDFLKFGSDLEGYGKRYVKFSDKKAEHGFAKEYKYFGEWSETTQKPHGRGIVIDSDGVIYIQYFHNSVSAPGNFIKIQNDGDVDVGEVYLKDGKICFRGTQYNTDGKSIKFDR